MDTAADDSRDISSTLSPAKNQSKSPVPVPALYRDDGESEIESDDILDHPHSLHIAHQPMEVDVDAEGESDVVESEHGHSKSRPAPRVVFDDDGESEMEEPESEDEPDVPLSTSQKSKPPSSQTQGTFLHVSHKVFPNHNRPSGEPVPSSSSSFDRSTDAPFVPYARTAPPHSHASFQRAWLVPNPHIMHVKRREQTMMETAPSTNPSAHSPKSEPSTLPHTTHPRPPLPELRPKEIPQQYPYIIPRTPMPQEKRPPGARKALRRPYPCLYHDCQQAFPSPKDRGRHMDKHFEGRFECLRCNKKYARLDALKRHSSEQFRPKSMDGPNAKPYNVAVSCIGGFEAREWVELSGSRWLKPEHVLDLRLPDPQDPLYKTLSRLMSEAQRDANTYQAGREDSTASTSGGVQSTAAPLSTTQPILTSYEDAAKSASAPTTVHSDVEMVATNSTARPTASMASLPSESQKLKLPNTVIPASSTMAESDNPPVTSTPLTSSSRPSPHTEASTPAITVEA